MNLHVRYVFKQIIKFTDRYHVSVPDPVAFKDSTRIKIRIVDVTSKIKSEIDSGKKNLKPNY